MSLVKGNTVVNARRLRIGHMKDIITSYFEKAEGIFQSEINSPKLDNADRKITRSLSSSLALLADIGITTFLEEDSVTFGFPDKELRFTMPDNTISLFNIIELTRKAACTGFEALPFNANPITSKYIMMNESLVKLYDGTQFYLESIDPTVITETYFLKTHYNFSFKDKIILDVGAAFGDTAIWFAKQGATVLAVEPGNFEWLVKNMELNNISTDKVIPLNLAAGIDGLVEIERVSTLSFDGEARIHGVNREHSKENAMIPGSSIKNIISKVGFVSVDYLKSDCKGCESFFSSGDFKVIKSGVEIECSANNTRPVLDVLKSSGFKTVMWYYDGNNHEALRDNGTILAARVV
jgi:FkbM family methyltransferase